MHANIPNVDIAHAAIATIEVGRLSLGQITVGHLTVSDTAFGISSGRALLSDVTITMRLDFQLEWSVVIPLPWPFDDFVLTTQTSDLGGVELPFPFGDAEITGLSNINLLIPSLTADNLTTSADPVDGLRINQVGADGVHVSDIVLPTQGFTLMGLGLAGIRVDQVAVPAATVAGAAVEHIGGAPISLPSLRLRGLALPDAAANDITSGALDLPVRRVDPYETPTIPLGVLTVKLRVFASARMHAAAMKMTGVHAHATVGTVELRDVSVPFDAVNLTLSDLGVDTISIPLIGVT